MNPTADERITACLKGIAIGDAVGKQTENLTRADVLRWYPHGIAGFAGTAGTVIPRYAGNAKHEWRIGETTDDTERTIAVARAILKDEAVHHVSVGREMLQCRKSVHPGVRSLWEFHQAADPSRVAHRHDGCGAAVRMAPVGILYRSHRLNEIIRGAREASISTHGGALAIAAAAATAAAVSAAIDGASSVEIFELASRATIEAEGQQAGSRVFGDALREMHDDLAMWGELRAPEVAGTCSPVSPLTIVPLAIALGVLLRSATAAILLAANTGGDSDSVASIAGAILGARFPDTVNAEWFAVVEDVNHHNLVPLAEALNRLRR